MKTQRSLPTFVFAILSIAILKSDAIAQEVYRFQLENGLRVIVNPIEEASDIAVESLYGVGFIHEPEGMVQASHLLEHLVCYAPGAGFETKGAMQWMNQQGMANAETLPTLTHYDYAIAADELEKVLEIESARLQQTQFDKQLLLAEAKRVYQETDFVENNPAAGMLKHAFMSLSHVWNYQSKETLVRGGLEEFDLDQLKDFYRTTYHPGNATLVISGKTTLDEAKTLVKKHFDSIPANENKPKRVDWKQVPARNTVGWDSAHSAVCISWAPPSEARDQQLLSILGLALMQKLMNHPELENECEMVMTSNNSWHVGELPFFVYAMAKPDVDLDELEQKLLTLVKEEVEKATTTAPHLAKALGRNYQFQLRPTAWARAQQMAKMLESRGRGSGKVPMQQVILHDALTRALIYDFLGDEPVETIKNWNSLKQSDFQKLLKETLAESRQNVVHLLPNQK